MRDAAASNGAVIPRFQSGEIAGHKRNMTQFSTSTTSLRIASDLEAGGGANDAHRVGAGATGGFETHQQMMNNFVDSYHVQNERDDGDSTQF